MSFLVDTNVISEIRRTSPAPSVRDWFDDTPSTEIHLSVLVVGEIRKGIELLRPREQERATALQGWLDGLVQGFGDRILPVGAEVAASWGALTARRPLPVVDGLLLATAEVHGLTLVTREARTFADLGVRVLDPWTT